MLINNLLQVDLINYKKISMFVGMPSCNGKCWRELNLSPDICQNNSLQTASKFSMSIPELIEIYQHCELTKAVVFGGLEPLESYKDLLEFVTEFRKVSDDDIVIYTGYTEQECETICPELMKNFHNIVIKFGRYVPNNQSHYDAVLGINLASDNQYAKRFGGLDDKN